jgi:hypothetical protein
MTTMTEIIKCTTISEKGAVGLQSSHRQISQCGLSYSLLQFKLQ